MDDIARHLSISKKTIYQFFTDKDDLVYRVTENHIGCMKSVMESIFSCKKTPKSDFTALEKFMGLGEFLKYQSANTNPAIGFDLQKYHPRSWGLFQHHKEEVIKKEIIENIIQGISEGDYRKDLNAEVMAIMRVRQIDDTLNPDVYGRSRVSFNEVHLQLLDHFVLGLLSEKGPERYYALRAEWGQHPLNIMVESLMAQFGQKSL